MRTLVASTYYDARARHLYVLRCALVASSKAVGREVGPFTLDTSSCYLTHLHPCCMYLSHLGHNGTVGVSELSELCMTV